MKTKKSNSKFKAWGIQDLSKDYGFGKLLPHSNPDLFRSRKTARRYIRQWKDRNVPPVLKCRVVRVRVSIITKG